MTAVRRQKERGQGDKVAHTGAHGPDVKASVLAQLAWLKSAPTAALKARWRELFETEPPAYNRRFLESRLAYRIQELAYVIRKFINEAYHIENEYVMQLNPHKFESIPEYVVAECERMLALAPAQ